MTNITENTSRFLNGSVRIQKIYDDGKHNAFTTITEWQGALYVAFRSASSHVNPKTPEGDVTVLSSRDRGASWGVVTTLRGPDRKDLRDPKLLATPNRLYVFAFEYKSPEQRDALVSWSVDGQHFTEPVRALAEPNYVIWWPVYNQGAFFAAGYRYTGDKHGIRSTMFQSNDGVAWRPLTTIFNRPWANETALVMTDDGAATALVRNDGDRLNPPVGDGMPIIARSNPPFDYWRYVKINRKLSGMAMVPIDEGYFITARDHTEDGAKTACFLITHEAVQKAKYVTGPNNVITEENGIVPKHLFTLPSGGDTSYAGFVVDGRDVLMSYYSSHGYLNHSKPNPAAIYLATFNLDDVFQALNNETGDTPWQP